MRPVTLAETISSPAAPLQRREFLASASAAGFLLAAPASASTLAQPGEIDRLEALVKMRGSTDGRIGFSYLRGTRFARVGHEIRPMCGLLNCTINRYRRLSPDSFDLRLYELSFYTDPATGRYTPKLPMPFTGTIVDVPLYRTGPGKHVVRTANQETMSWGRENTTSQAAADALAPKGAIEYSVELSQATIAANNIWLTTEATTKLLPADPEEKPWYYKELISNHASLDAVSDPHRTWVDSVASYSLVMDWRPWMKMDGMDGQTIDHAVGARSWELDDLPADIVWHLRNYHPDVANDPYSWLGD